MSLETAKVRRKEWKENDARRDAGLVEPEGLIKQRNIEYKAVDGDKLLLDIYRPKESEGLLPTIVNIHGGGFFYGDKELYRFYCMSLAQRGYAVVNFNYRLAPEHCFPKQLQDINDVFGWISKHGKNHGMDINNVYITGDSAGANLAAHYATIHTNEEYSRCIGIEPARDIAIRAISLSCGLYDLKEVHTNSESDREFIDDYLGEVNLDDERVNYLKYVDDNYPPAFVFTAYYDFLRDYCGPMCRYLLKRGIHAKFKMYGNDRTEYMSHVFNVNMKLSEASMANDDQVSFFADYFVKV